MFGEGRNKTITHFKFIVVLVVWLLVILRLSVGFRSSGDLLSNKIAMSFFQVKDRHISRSAICLISFCTGKGKVVAFVGE